MQSPHAQRYMAAVNSKKLQTARSCVLEVSAGERRYCVAASGLRYPMLQAWPGAALVLSINIAWQAVC